MLWKKLFSKTNVTGVACADDFDGLNVHARQAMVSQTDHSIRCYSRHVSKVGVGVVMCKLCIHDRDRTSDKQDASCCCCCCCCCCCSKQVASHDSLLVQVFWCRCFGADVLVQTCDWSCGSLLPYLAERCRHANSIAPKNSVVWCN